MNDQKLCESKNETSKNSEKMIEEEDEMIDMDNYTRDTRNMILTDETVQSIINDTSKGGIHQKNLMDAFKALKTSKFGDFRKIVSDDRSIINMKHDKTYLIHEACRLGNPECVSLLMFLGARCSVLDDRGMMAQHYAVQSRSTVVIDILSLFGNSMNVNDKDGNTPFYCALQNNDKTMIRSLMTYKVDPIMKEYVAKDSDFSAMLADYVNNF